MLRLKFKSLVFQLLPFLMVLLSIAAAPGEGGSTDNIWAE